MKKATVAKAHMVNALFVEQKIPKGTAEQVVDCLATLIEKELVAGNRVSIPGVGTLIPKFRKKGTRKAFGKEIDTKDRLCVTFKKSAKLDEAYVTNCNLPAGGADEMQAFRASLKVDK